MSWNKAKIMTIFKYKEQKVELTKKKKKNVRSGTKKLSKSLKSP